MAHNRSGGVAQGRLHQRERRVNRCAADERACFIGIEPNPRFTERLRTQERALRANGVRAKIYTETALALTDGFATLYAQNTSKQKVWTPYTRWTEVESVGSSLEPSKQMTGWNEKGVFFTRKWTIAGEFTGKNTGKRAEGPPPEAADYSRVRVETLGAARFLRSLMRASGMRRDAVYVKLDVEGSEVALLKGLLVTEPAALCRLGALLVEWHTTRLMGPRGRRRLRTRRSRGCCETPTAACRRSRGIDFSQSRFCPPHRSRHHVAEASGSVVLLFDLHELLRLELRRRHRLSLLLQEDDALPQLLHRRLRRHRRRARPRDVVVGNGDLLLIVVARALAAALDAQRGNGGGGVPPAVCLRPV